MCPLCFTCMLCVLCACCVPYALGTGCVLCVLAVRYVLCLAPSLHHSATQSRACSSAFISHRNSFPGRVYDIPLSPCRPFSCTPGLIVQCPSQSLFLTFVYGNPNLSVLGSILYFLCSVSCVPALCPVFSLNKCCLFCALAVCRYYLGIIGCVLGVFAVRYVLCVSCYAPQ